MIKSLADINRSSYNRSIESTNEEGNEMAALIADIQAWERELKALKEEGAEPAHLAKIEALLERLYLKVL